MVYRYGAQRRKGPLRTVGVPLLGSRIYLKDFGPKDHITQAFQWILVFSGRLLTYAAYQLLMLNSPKKI